MTVTIFILHPFDFLLSAPAAPLARLLQWK
jgi:hypothetical protein